MERLSEAMYEAVAAPPPTRIDLDHIIARERRHRWRLRALAGGALVLAVVVAASAATLGVRFIGRGPAGGPETPDPSASPQPVGRCTAKHNRVPPSNPPATPDPPAVAVPTEPTDAAVLRLSTVLNRAIRSAMPGVSVVDVIHPTCAGIQFSDHHPPELYHADFDVVDARGVAGSITITVHYGRMPTFAGYPDVQTLPDGTRVSSWVVAFEDSSARSSHAFVARPDGTKVRLMAADELVGGGDSLNRAEAPATPEQLVAIGTDPGLTLYP